MNKTTPTRALNIKREWHLVDAKDNVLGRISSKIATILMGKSKPYFVRNLDCGDYVVIINAKDIKVSGKKETLKKYNHYSGYPGGLRIDTLKDLRENNPERIIYHAVNGMLPQNKLKDKLMKRLFVFSGKKHPYGDKFKS